MGFLNALGTVSRRSRWRRPLLFYDFDAGGLHDVTDATLSLTLFREDPNRVPHRFGPEHAVGCWPGSTPPLVVTSDDGNSYLLPDGANRGKLDVPATLVATVPEGLYWASIIATFPDGSFVEVLCEAVRFAGPALPPPPLSPFLTADSGLGSDTGNLAMAPCSAASRSSSTRRSPPIPASRSTARRR